MFAHISDTHLGAAPYGLKEREEDFYRVFREAVEVILKDHIRVVIHTGDLLDEPRLPGKPLLELLNQTRRMASNKTRMYLILGEHDFRRVQHEVPIPKVLDELGLVKLLRNGEVVTDRENNLVITGFHKFRRDEVYKGSNPLVRRLGEASRRVSGLSGRKVLMLHQGLTEFHRHAGELSVRDLPAGFDYYAMGHLHDRGVMNPDNLSGPVVYPGSTEVAPQEQIPSGGVEKGFYIVDVSGDQPRLEWVRLGARPHFRVEMDYSRIEAEVERVAGLIKARPNGLKPVLQVTVRGRGVDSRRVSAELAKLRDLVLTLRYRIESVEDKPVAASRSRPVEEELLELASRVLGSREKARVAVLELLPALSSGDLDEALNVLLRWWESD